MGMEQNRIERRRVPRGRPKRAGGIAAAPALAARSPALRRRVDELDRAVGKAPVRPQQPQRCPPGTGNGQRDPVAEQDRQNDDIEPVERADLLERADRPTNPSTLTPMRARTSIGVLLSWAAPS